MREIVHQMSVTLSLPPSVNEAYADVIKKRRDGRLYVRRVATERLTVYKREVYYILAEHQFLLPIWQSTQKIGYSATIHVGRKNADLSNYIKAYEDSIAEALQFDDKHIIQVHLDKAVDTACPRIEGHWYIYR